MARAKDKIAFSQDLNAAIMGQFERLCQQLPGKKFEILEAALRAYMALPMDYQLCLLSPQLDLQKQACDILMKLRRLRIALPPDDSAKTLTAG